MQLTYGFTGGAIHCWSFHHLVPCHTLAGVGPVCVVTELTAGARDITLINVYRASEGKVEREKGERLHEDLIHIHVY